MGSSYWGNPFVVAVAAGVVVGPALGMLVGLAAAVDNVYDERTVAARKSIRPLASIADWPIP